MLVVDLHILWKDKLKQWKFWTRNSFKYIEVSVTSDNKIRFVFRTWYLMVQEVVAEDETEFENGSDSDEKAHDMLGMERKISRESQQNGQQSRGDSRRMSEVNIDSKLPTRKPSAANSASSSNMPSRNWSRHSSPTRGEILRMEDEMHTVNRGGVEMTIPLNITHHIPPKLLGQLDEEGILICDRWDKIIVFGWRLLQDPKHKSLKWVFLVWKWNCYSWQTNNNNMYYNPKWCLNANDAIP